MHDFNMHQISISMHGAGVGTNQKFFFVKKVLKKKVRNPDACAEKTLRQTLTYISSLCGETQDC